MNSRSFSLQSCCPSVIMGQLGKMIATDVPWRYVKLHTLHVQAGPPHKVGYRSNAAVSGLVGDSADKRHTADSKLRVSCPGQTQLSRDGEGRDKHCAGRRRVGFMVLVPGI